MLPPEDREFQELLEKQEAEPQTLQTLSSDSLSPPKERWDWRVKATIGLILFLVIVLSFFTHKILNPPA